MVNLLTGLQKQKKYLNETGKHAVTEVKPLPAITQEPCWALDRVALVSGASMEIKPVPALSWMQITHPLDTLMHESVSSWTNLMELLQTFTDTLPAQRHGGTDNAI